MRGEVAGVATCATADTHEPAATMVTITSDRTLFMLTIYYQTLEEVLTVAPLGTSARCDPKLNVGREIVRETPVS